MSGNDDWNHRSQFTDPDEAGTRTVSGAVNERAEGPTLTRQEARAFTDDVEIDAREPDEAGERRLHEHFDARHIPRSYWASIDDDQPPRERLLAGETIDTSDL